MKTFILAAMLVVTAASSVVVTFPAFAGDAGGFNPERGRGRR